MILSLKQNLKIVSRPHKELILFFYFIILVGLFSSDIHALVLCFLLLECLYFILHLSFFVRLIGYILAQLLAFVELDSNR